MAQQSSAQRILVIDDDQGVSKLMERVLVKAGFEVSLARSGEEGLTMIPVIKPDLLIVDLMLPGMDGFEVVRRVRQEQSLRLLPVLMLTSLTDRDSKIAGFTVGADDYLTKPFDPKDLVYRIISLLARREAKERPKMAVGATNRMFIFFSGKGGVGKTTIASNFAVALRQLTRRSVLLFDADFSFGDVGVHLNVPSHPTVFDLLSNDTELDREFIRQVIIRHASGVDVLLSPPRPQNAELIRIDFLNKLVPHLQQMYDYVIVDGQPAYDERMLLLLEQADDIMLVVTPEVGPIRNTSLFLDLVKVLELEKPQIHLILNRANSRVGIEVADIERILKQRIRFRVASGGRAVVLAVNQGLPLVAAQPDHPLSLQILDMARQLTGITAPAR